MQKGKKVKTIAQLSDEILGFKEQEKALAGQIDDLKEKREALELQLIEEAAKHGLNKGAGGASTFKIEDVTVPQGQDWDEFYAYIHEKKFYHLLQRRLSSTAFQELWGQGVNVPGVDKFTKTKVTVKGA